LDQENGGKDKIKKPWDVWTKVGGLFEASAEICVVRALMEGGEDRKTLASLNEGRKEDWIWILDPDELEELEAKKRESNRNLLSSPRCFLQIFHLI